MLLLPYALFRWASGRDAAIGAAIMLAAMVSSLGTSWTGIGDAIGGAIVLTTVVWLLTRASIEADAADETFATTPVV